jgi:hypothetical protein
MRLSYSYTLILSFNPSYSLLRPPTTPRPSPQRHEKRLGWIAREAEPAFLCVPEDCRPLPCPLSLDAELRLTSFLPVGALLEGSGGRDASLDPYSPPEALNLLDLARRLEQWKSQFLARAKSAPAPHFQQK